MWVRSMQMGIGRRMGGYNRYLALVIVVLQVEMQREVDVVTLSGWERATCTCRLQNATHGLFDNKSTQTSLQNSPDHIVNLVSAIE